MRAPGTGPLRILRASRDDHGLRTAWRLGLRQGWVDRHLLAEAERFVVFVGHGFSGHSLIGSLLNAHPDAVIAHELDILRYVGKGYSRRQLLGLIRFRDLDWERRGRIQNSYSYAVPDQWQGRVRRLTVIGDKKGGGTTIRLADDPSLLTTLRAEIGLPLRVLHVTRSPLDNIGSMTKTMGYPVEEATAIWRRQVETCSWLHTELGEQELLLLSTEEFKTDPAGHLAQACDFLGLSPDPEYLAACSSIVTPDRSLSRTAVATWPESVLAEIATVVTAHPWLSPYADDLRPELTF